MTVLASSALGYFTAIGSGVAGATVGLLTAPTITSATPGAGTVALSWSAASAPPGGTISYYVTRAGGTVGGNCPSSAATATTSTSCTDSGLTRGTYTYTVTAVWRSWTATSASSQVTLASGALSKFNVSTPGAATAGTAFTATITAQDSAGNTVTGYAGSQTLAFSGPSNSPSGTGPQYPASVTFTNGTGSASITLYDAQTTTLTATQGSASGTSTSISVAAGANHQIAASASTPQTAGTAFTVTLTAKDTWGNTPGTLSGVKSVSFSGPSNSPAGNAPSYPATVTFAAGSASASVTTYDAQTTTITANDTTDSFSGTASTNIVVNAAGASSFTVPTPSTQMAGTAFTENLTALDSYGNTAAGYSGSKAVTFTGPANAPGGTAPSYPATVTFTNGTGSASITLYDAQSTTLTATQGTVTGASGAFTVAPGSASSFNMPTPASPQTAGTAFNVSLTELDAYGNTETGYSGAQAITFSGPSNSPAGTAPSYPATVTFASGAGTASITLYDAQSTTLTATQGTVTGTTGSFTVNAAATVKRLGLSSTAVSGASSSTANLGPITVQEQDQYGNPRSGGGALTVNLSSTSAAGVFSTSQFGANVTSVTIASGQSTANLYYGDRNTGTPTITAAGAGLTSGTQQETITTAPAGLGMTLAAGSTGTPSVSCGAVALSYTCNVTGVGVGGQVVFYATFVNATGTQVTYSSTQSSTITESGNNSGSVTIAASAGSSSPNTLTASHVGNSTKTSTLTFGPYTLTINVSS